jgi:hypothetical protein
VAGPMLSHSRKSSLTADLYAYLQPEMAEGMVEGVERLLRCRRQTRADDAPASRGSAMVPPMEQCTERKTIRGTLR